MGALIEKTSPISEHSPKFLFASDSPDGVHISRSLFHFPSVPQADDCGPAGTAAWRPPQVAETAHLATAPVLRYLWYMQLSPLKRPAEDQPDHFPSHLRAVRGSMTLDFDSFINLHGPKGRAARIVQRLGLEKFCWETELSRATARRIRDHGLSRNGRSYIAVIACLKKHGG